VDAPTINPAMPVHCLYSITRRLFTLPGSTLVYPGHDYNGRACSTIAEEKAYNPQPGNDTSRDKFISIMQDLQLEQPQSFRNALPANLNCGLSG
jgi:glyoxylase-like metal-dependent hydrolase (beta-lactamase superfamily II)